jgi:hypothetical protein
MEAIYYFETTLRHYNPEDCSHQWKRNSDNRSLIRESNPVYPRFESEAVTTELSVQCSACRALSWVTVMFK